MAHLNTSQKRICLPGSHSASLGVMAATVVLLAVWSPAIAAQHKTKSEPAAKAPVQPVISENDKIVHVLNRLGFGPRPDDVDEVKKIGLFSYIQKQLHPEEIDDSDVEKKLMSYTELNSSDADIMAKYRDFILQDREAAKLRQQLNKMANSAAAPASGTQPGMPMQGQNGAPMTAGGQTPPAAPPANNIPKREAVAEMLNANPEMAKQVRDTQIQLATYAQPIGLLHQEFNAAKLIRAVESKRQFQEVMVDFWSNHFNIDIRKAPCGVLKVLDDREAIRPHVFGKFRDLLEASAKSPAMLVYLDNFQSVADNLPLPNQNRRRFGAGLQNRPGRFALNNPQNPLLPARPVNPKRKIGLNENYAREIMELHTLGVDGGYTQQDVREVARCLTGWGMGSPDGTRQPINRYAEAGAFQFHPFVHDDGEKVVLGHTIPAGGGIQDGETVLDILASHPATMRHISYQLCQRLVCDDPPASLVNKCVATWKQTDGDLREIYRTIVMSPEFFSPIAMRKKIKSPFEYGVSAVRALDGTMNADALVSRNQLPRVLTAEANRMIRPPQGGAFLDVNTNTLYGQITTMGEPLFQYLAPTGFPEDSRKWVSSGALISRLNFSLALTQNRIKDVKLEDPAEDATMNMEPNALINRLATRILHGEISPSTRATLLNEASSSSSPAGNNGMTPATIAALLLGSPEFQRR